MVLFGYRFFNKDINKDIVFFPVLPATLMNIPVANVTTNKIKVWIIFIPALLIPSLSSWQLAIVFHPHSFVFSSISYQWNGTVCRLLSWLVSFITKHMEFIQIVAYVNVFFSVEYVSYMDRPQFDSATDGNSGCF